MSVCSGIEAATVAWHNMGWKPVGFSEIEKFPSQVLAHHYPEVTNYGDMTKFKEWNINEPVNLLVGGTPCQSFSVAGLRKGLDDPRGNLMLTFLAIADHYKPKWIVWENVPGVLSSNGGKDFATFLGALGEIGYGFAYRVLDAQYFGVAQRRRRVFVVGCLGDWRSAAAVLFDSESLRGNPAPSREKREEVAQIARTLAANGGGLNRVAGNANELDFCVTVGALDTECGFTKASHQSINAGHILPIPFREADLANYKKDEAIGTLKSSGGCLGGGSESLLVHSMATKTYSQNIGVDIASPLCASDYKEPQAVFALAENTIGRQPQNGGNGDGFTLGGPMYTLNATGVHGVAHAFKIRGGCEGGGKGYLGQDDLAFTISTTQDQHIAQPIPFGVGEQPDVGHCLRSGASKADKHESTTYIKQSMAVRRLTPTECERLQGFPDGYTDIQPNGKPAADGPRYKALGNSMAVPVMRWIGERINFVDKIK